MWAYQCPPVGNPAHFPAPVPALDEIQDLLDNFSAKLAAARNSQLAITVI